MPAPIATARRRIHTESDEGGTRFFSLPLANFETTATPRIAQEEHQRTCNDWH